MAIWWNTSYSFRRNLKITPLSGRSVLAGSPIYVNISHSNYVGKGKLRADFQDLEIIYQDETGATPVIQVLGYATDYDSETGNIEIVFNAVEDIDAVDNVTYYMYFSNPSLTNDPATPSWIDSTFSEIITPADPGDDLTFSRPNEEWINGLSTTINARAALSFHGKYARLVAEVGPGRGIMELKIDNGDPVYIDTYQASAFQNKTVYTTSNLEDIDHFIRIRVTGDKAPAASDYQIKIARFELSQYIEAVPQVEEIHSTSAPVQLIVGP